MATKRCTNSTKCDSVDSCLNDAMLMTSTDTLSDTVASDTDNNSSSAVPKISVTMKQDAVADILKRCGSELCTSTVATMKKILSHTTNETNKSLCDSFEELTSTSIEKSILWPSLTALQKSFTKSPENEAKKNIEVIDDLHKMYDSDPYNFTEHLLTIIEEGSDLSLSNPWQDSWQKLSQSSTLDSTQYMKLKNYHEKDKNNDEKTAGKSPNDLQHSKAEHSTCNIKILRGMFLSPKPGNPGQNKTPVIIITPGTPRSHNDIASPINHCEEEDYVTAESEIEDWESKTMVDSEKSQNESVNMSKAAKHHNEWVETFDKVSRYAIDRTYPTTMAQGKTKIMNHATKLEKRWLRELSMKRQKCFDTVNILLEKAAATKSQECDEECICHRCKKQMEFFNTLLACSEYYMYACNKKEPRISSRTIGKKNSPLVSRSPTKSTKRNVCNSNTENNSTKKVSRKSLGKKIKSPSGRYKSPRRSIYVKPIMRKSPRLNTRAIPEIDRSSIRSVSQLRAIFSPRSKVSGLGQSEKLNPKQGGSQSYISTLSLMPSASKSRAASKNNMACTGSSTNKYFQFKHVKSPVGEYIRGKKL